MTDKRQKATKVKCKGEESRTKQLIFVEYSLLLKKHLSFAAWSTLADEHNTLPKSNRRHVKLVKFISGPSWLPNLLCKHWFASSVWNFCPESQTFLRAKRPQQRRARRNGCFRRLENRLGCQVGETGKYNATRGKDGSTVNQPHTFVLLQWTDPDRAVTTDTTHILKQREHFYWQVNLPLPVLIVEMNFTSNLQNLLPRAPLYQMLNNKIMLLMTQKRYTRLFREGLSKKQKNAHYYPEM